MGAVTAAVQAALAGDSTLTALISTFEGAPAVFTVDPVPETAALPYVQVSEVTTNPFDTKTHEGLTVLRDVRCFAEDTGSAALVESIADRVREIFHREHATISVTGFTTTVVSADAVIPNDGDDVYGRTVTIRLVLEET